MNHFPFLLPVSRRDDLLPSSRRLVALYHIAAAEPRQVQRVRRRELQPNPAPLRPDAARLQRFSTASFSSPAEGTGGGRLGSRGTLSTASARAANPLNDCGRGPWPILIGASPLNPRQCSTTSRRSEGVEALAGPRVSARWAITSSITGLPEACSGCKNGRLRPSDASASRPCHRQCVRPGARFKYLAAKRQLTRLTGPCPAFPPPPRSRRSTSAKSAVLKVGVSSGAVRSKRSTASSSPSMVKTLAFSDESDCESTPRSRRCVRKGAGSDRGCSSTRAASPRLPRSTTRHGPDFQRRDSADRRPASIRQSMRS